MMDRFGCLEHLAEIMARWRNPRLSCKGKFPSKLEVIVFYEQFLSNYHKLCSCMARKEDHPDAKQQCQTFATAFPHDWQKKVFKWAKNLSKNRYKLKKWFERFLEMAELDAEVTLNLALSGRDDSKSVLAIQAKPDPPPRKPPNSESSSEQQLRIEDKPPVPPTPAPKKQSNPTAQRSQSAGPAAPKPQPKGQGVGWSPELSVMVADAMNKAWAQMQALPSSNTLVVQSNPATSRSNSAPGHSGPPPGGCLRCRGPHKVADCPNKDDPQYMICTRCGVTGHKATVCTAVTQCSNCGKNGHIAETCEQYHQIQEFTARKRMNEGRSNSPPPTWTQYPQRNPSPGRANSSGRGPNSPNWPRPQNADPNAGRPSGTPQHSAPVAAVTEAPAENVQQ